MFKRQNFTEALNVLRIYLKLDFQLSSISLWLNQFKLQINELQ